MPRTLGTLTLEGALPTVMVTVLPLVAELPFLGLVLMTLPTLSELSLYWTLTSKPAFLRVVVALSSESPTTLGMTTWLVPLEMW